MNSYGHTNGPEIAMLDELHTLWGRTFGGASSKPGRAPLGRVVLALAGVAAIVAVVWVLV